MLADGNTIMIKPLRHHSGQCEQGSDQHRKDKTGDDQTDTCISNIAFATFTSQHINQIYEQNQCRG